MNNSDNFPKSKITAIILAGGRAQRMGGEDKGLLMLLGKPMIEYIIERIQPQVGSVLISANRNLERYQHYGFPVVPDTVGEYAGPLAGMASGIQSTKTDYVVIVPCDSPLLPNNLVSILYHQLQTENAKVAVAHDGDRMQPMFALLHCDLLPDLLRYLESGERRVDTWFMHQSMVIANFSGTPDAFMNVNSPDEQKAVEKLLEEETS